MSQPPKITAANQLAIYFETNSIIPLGDVAEFFAALEEFAVTDQAFQAVGPLHLVQAGTGTFWAVFEQVLEHSDKLASIGGFALSLVTVLQTSRGRLPKITAHMTVEHGIRTTTVITCEGSNDVTRDMMPLVRVLERQLNAQAADNLLTSDGDLITIDGEPISVGPSPPPAVEPHNGWGDEVSPQDIEFAAQAVASDGSAGKLILKPGDTRERRATVRRLEQTSHGWFALHEPHGGHTVPAFAPPGHVLNFRQTRVTVRGHLYRRNGSPLAFIVSTVLDGGEAVKTNDRQPH